MTMIACIQIVLIVVGVSLVGSGVYALFKLRGDTGGTEVRFGKWSIATKSPAVTMALMGLAAIGGTPYLPAGARAVTGNVTHQPTKGEPLPSDVVASYMGLVSTYNARDADGYYGHFKSPLECFYNHASADIRNERRDLTAQLAVMPADLTALEVTPTRVEFCDRGSWRRPSGLLRPHTKIIVMEKIDGAWLVTVETSRDLNLCYLSPHADAC